MLQRVAAVVSALAIPLIFLIEPVSGPLRALGPIGPWIGPVLAALCALPVIIAGREHLTQALAGAALAALATGLTPALPELLRVSNPDSLTVVDLRSEVLPADHAERSEYLALRGFLRDEWVIDEYPGGERPDQNQRPDAVLVPLLGTEAIEAELEGLMVVARVAPETLEQPPLQTLRGRTRAVAPELVDALVALQGGMPGPGNRPPAVLFDTFDVPTRGQAWTRVGLSAGAAVLALLLLLTTLPTRKPAGE
ncbi:MAG: hypothetical protein KC457_00595 [Myxococcales bacterium]|nr:hypothetical protein [Myxococcales bacterium]